MQNEKLKELILENEDLFKKVLEKLQEDYKNVFEGLNWLDYNFNELSQKQNSYYYDLKVIFKEIYLKSNLEIDLEKKFEKQLWELKIFESLDFNSFWDIKKRYLKNIEWIIKLFDNLDLKIDNYIF